MQSALAVNTACRSELYESSLVFFFFCSSGDLGFLSLCFISSFFLGSLCLHTQTTKRWKKTEGTILLSHTQSGPIEEMHIWILGTIEGF